MVQDKFEPDDLHFLGLRDREMLLKLAEKDGRSELEELKWLIRARATGKLKDLGDEPIAPQVSERDLPLVLHGEKLRLEVERDTHGFDDASRPNRPPTKPK